MKERLNDLLVCPVCRTEMTLIVNNKKSEEIIEGSLHCGNGHKYPIKDSIPRFVQLDSYAGSFSFEWQKFSKVQLDNFNGTTESEDTFFQKTGFDKTNLRGRLILDAGVGAGRFSEVVSRLGGEIVGVDLSFAVDASYANIGERPNVHLIQADIFALPFREEIFDYVFSIGVLHHTTDTHKAFKSLLPFLKPGGEIAIWLYAKYYEGVQTISTFLRKVTTRMPGRLVYYMAGMSVPLYYLLGPLRKIIFPIFQFSLHRNPRWRWLDTFDWYTPKYVWKHTYPEVFKWFKDAGLKDITLPAHPISMKGRK